MLRDRGFLTNGGSTLALAWNPVDKSSNVTLAANNLTADFGSGAVGSVRANNAISAGKWYWELLVVPNAAFATSLNVGVLNGSTALGAQIGATSGDVGIRTFTGQVLENNTVRATGSAFADNDICMVALDTATGKIWFGKNGTWYFSGDPAAGTGEAYTYTGATIYPAASGEGTAFATSGTNARFLASMWTYSAPSGFGALTA